MVPALFTTAVRDPALAELVSYSSKVAPRKRRRRSAPSNVQSLHLSSENWLSAEPAVSAPEGDRAAQPRAEAIPVHAPPLMPLREQDSQALTELFIHDDIDSIVTDIAQTLSKYHPEPCWEDELAHALDDLPNGCP